MGKILPIEAYGSKVLRKMGEDIDKDYPNLAELIENMYETMYNASGVGLAAPQIGLPIRLFVIDASPFAEPDDDGNVDEMAKGLEDFKRVFINAEIIHEEGEEWGFEEGCLSIPKIREEVFREEKIRMTYYDENWNFHDEEFDGFAARIIQHEYDHIDGVLFTDHLKPLRKRLIQRKLKDISMGKVDIGYRMNFPVKSKLK
jgi:peptide deformylase